MYLIRFLTILLLAWLIQSHHLLIWLKPINDSPWQKSKTLTIPLLIQSFVEPCFYLESHYFPSRLLALVVTMIIFLFLITLTQKYHAHSFLEKCIWLFSLIIGFYVESQMMHANYSLHPYDPYFAFLGLFFILLAYIILKNPFHH